MAERIHISIEGNIGVGKTTVLEKLEASGGLSPFSVFKENVDEWQFLAPYYQNPKDYTLLLQLEILIDFKKIRGPGHYLSERSSRTSIEVFSKLNLENNILSPQDFQFLHRVEALLGATPTHYIYFDLQPDLAFQRIQKRQRPAEKEITLDYIQKLDHYYEKFLSGVKEPVFVIDASQPEEQVAEDFLRIIQSNFKKE